MDRIFLGGVVVAIIVAMRLVCIKDPILGSLVTGLSVWVFLFLANREMEKLGYPGRYSDPAGPNQGWDPRTVEAGKRRADGIE